MDQIELYSIKKSCKSNVYHITLSKTLEDEAFQYQDVIDLLRNEATEDDEINIYLDCNGGSTSTSCVIADAIRSCKASVTVIVISRSYSAACDIALAGDMLEMRPYTFLMFHNYSAEIGGKGNELAARIKNEHRIEEQMINRLYRPFLTNNEIKDILNDKDIYIHWDDKDLVNRIIRHFKLEED